jgi:23S rRNA (cytidine1920-2'-O)/16S rRNA (cytidine1409-2'-O)-methyltransferase
VRLRLDQAVVERGLAKSRERAKALIMQGRVLVGRVPATKAGSMVDADAEITLKGQDIPYVGRGGLKLEAALETFGIDPSGRVAMDVGASTGGFTDCLLQRGARVVYAVDVGYGQLDWKLRQDERVVLFERMNIRHMERSSIPETVGLAVIDVSFISLKLVLPKVREFMERPGGEVVALVKPQFEVGRADVGKGGIVRDPEKRLAALMGIEEFCAEIGLRVMGTMESPVPGAKGNIEYLLHAVESE